MSFKGGLRRTFNFLNSDYFRYPKGAPIDLVTLGVTGVVMGLTIPFSAPFTIAAAVAGGTAVRATFHGKESLQYYGDKIKKIRNKNKTISPD